MLPYQNLIKAYEKSKFVNFKGQILKFAGIEGLDAFNPVLFRENERTYLAARVEPRDSDWNDLATYHPQINFFEKKEGVWQKIPTAPTIDLAEDPFCTWIKDGKRDRLLFGYVRIDRRTNPPMINTRLHLVNSLFDLSEKTCFFVIEEMRDIRFLQLPFGKILICTRPWIKHKGRVGFTMIDSIVGLNKNIINSAQILDSHVSWQVHLGNNQLYFLRNNLIGTLGHAAYTDENGNYIYSSAVWNIKLDTTQMSVPKLIVRRKNFPVGPAKSARQKDIVFSGSFEDISMPNVRLFCGLNDTSCGTITLPNPFLNS